MLYSKYTAGNLLLVILCSMVPRSRTMVKLKLSLLLGSLLASNRVLIPSTLCLASTGKCVSVVMS